MKVLDGIRQERGYALMSVLLLLVLLLVIGTLVMQSVTSSQGMVNVSEDIVSAQADGETKLLIKLSELRAAIMALKEKDAVTLEDVRDTAALYIVTGSATLDEDNQKYTAIVEEVGVSDNIRQTYRRKVEIILNYEPVDPSQPGNGGSEFAIVSQDYVNLSSRTTVIGHLYAKSGLNRNGADIQGKILAPSYPRTDLAAPARANVADVLRQTGSEADAVMQALKRTSPNPQELTVTNGTRTLNGSAIFSNVTMHPGTGLSVRGDLVITGSLNMHNGNTIQATGNIYIYGSVSAKGPLIQAKEKIWIGGSGNFDDPHKEGITLVGDLYNGGSLAFHTKLTAGTIYVGGATSGNLRDDNRFALYSDGPIAVNDSSSSTSLTGLLYSNGGINVNGNNGLIIRASGPGDNPKPGKPADIVINEAATTIN
ncbi:hypothetical protein [Paenibacillus macerans]|uniref:hypothetical protein n=1 Tax=Paenibacillus macerans TaxID=44252 RepID=UPI003D31157C